MENTELKQMDHQPGDHIISSRGEQQHGQTLADDQDVELNAPNRGWKAPGVPSSSKNRRVDQPPHVLEIDYWFQGCFGEGSPSTGDQLRRNAFSRSRARRLRKVACRTTGITARPPLCSSTRGSQGSTGWRGSSFFSPALRLSPTQLAVSARRLPRLAFTRRRCDESLAAAKHTCAGVHNRREKLGVDYFASVGVQHLAAELVLRN